MKPYIKIEIKNGKRSSTYTYRTELRNFGLTPKKTGAYTWVWNGTVSESIKDELIIFCKLHKLKLVASTEEQNRSTSYRTDFFKNYKLHYKDIYICSYCLIPHKKSGITVDHLIPVQKAKTNKFYQWLMKELNITNINDMKNLVPACKSCNSKKGSKGGLWILRGYLGSKLPCILIAYSFILFLIIYIARYYYVYFTG